MTDTACKQRAYHGADSNSIAFIEERIFQFYFVKMESTSAENVNIEMEVDQTEDNGANGVAIEDRKERQDFSSESNKIEISNMGKFAYGELRSLMKKLKMRPTKMKTKNQHGGKDHAYLCFRTVAEKEHALKVFDGFKWKGRTLRVKEAKALMDPLVKKRLEEEAIQNGAAPPRKPKIFQKKTVLEATAPLANLPYDEQIKRKENECVRHLQAYARAVKKASLELRPIIQAKEKETGMPCIWHGIKESPQTNGYRNKNEFAIGKNENGEKTVGFRLGSYSDGSIEVGSVQDLPHVPDRTKLAVRLYEAYINSSKYELFSMELYTGQFRQLTVRLSGSTGEIMLIIGIHTSEIQDELDDLLKDIIDYFTERDGKELNVTSIYLEEMNKRDIGQTHDKFRHIYGLKYITDTILGLKFRVSAASFFQINTKSAEVLYELAIKMSKVDSNTTVLDICCGTGTIGLCFAKVKKTKIKSNKK